LLRKLSEFQGSDGRVASDPVASKKDATEESDVEATALAASIWKRVPEYNRRAKLADLWLKGIRERKSTSAAAKSSATNSLASNIGNSNIGNSDIGNSDNRDIAQLGAKQRMQSVQDAKTKLAEDLGEVELTVKQGQEVRRQRVAVDALYGLVGQRLETLNDSAEVVLELERDKKTPMLATLKYSAKNLPETDEQCPLRITTSVSSAELQHRATAQVNVSIENHSAQPVSDAVAQVGLPSGVRVRIESLQLLQKMGVINSFRINQRSVNLHWKEMEAKRIGDDQIQLTFDIEGAFRGNYFGAPSSVHLGADSNTKNWTAGFKLDVVK
jgi:hypothetical protein